MTRDQLFRAKNCTRRPNRGDTFTRYLFRVNRENSKRGYAPTSVWKKKKKKLRDFRSNVEQRPFCFSSRARYDRDGRRVGQQQTVADGVRRVPGHGPAVFRRLRQHHVHRRRRGRVGRHSDRSDFRFHDRVSGAGEPNDDHNNNLIDVRRL